MKPLLELYLFVTISLTICCSTSSAGKEASTALKSLESDSRRASELVQEQPTPVEELLPLFKTTEETEDLEYDSISHSKSSKWKSPSYVHESFGDVLPNITVPVCCGMSQIFIVDTMVCEKSESKPVIKFHYEDGTPVEYQFAYTARPGFPNCSFYNLQPHIEPEDEFYVLPDGTLKGALGSRTSFSNDQFCLLATADALEALVCFPEVSSTQNLGFDRLVYRTLYPVGLIISAIFLFATFLVYCLVVELRDLLGKCLMCSVSALCIAQVSTVIVQMGTHMLSMTACIFTAVMMHFWYLSAFLWLNVICFNVFLTIWWKSDAYYGRVSRWFMFYSSYAWGLALIISSIALARDFSESMTDSNLPKPNFGAARCWFSGHNALIVYFYGPTSVILGLNVILFVASAYKLCSLNKSSEARVFQFSLYLKLFVLMGVTWIFEVISFFVQRHTEHSSINYAWIIFDIINISQGMIIFIVFVCRRAVLIRICEVLCGKSYALKKFPQYYDNNDPDIPNNEIKHSVI